MTKAEMKAKATEALSGKVANIYDIYVADTWVDVIGTISGDAVHYRVHFEGDEVAFVSCK